MIKIYKELFYTEDLENITEELVFEEIYKIIENKEKAFCKCNICIQDIAAIVLNKVPPRYKNSIVDKKFPDSEEEKRIANLRKMIRQEVLLAIDKIRTFSHH